MTVITGGTIGFNGAAVDERRKGTSLAVQIASGIQASMGPPSMNGGRSLVSQRSAATTRCFNGAAVDERRKVEYRAGWR